MKILNIIYCAALCLLSLSGCAQTSPLKDFVETPVPQPNSKQLDSLAYRTDFYPIALVNGKLQLQTYIPAFQAVTKLKLSHGTLIGVNMGEFGGGLYYKPNDTTLKQIYVNGEPRTAKIQADPFRGVLTIVNNSINDTIKDAILIRTGNGQHILNNKDTIYTIEGAVHKDMRDGSVNQLYFKGDSVADHTILKLDDDAPIAIARYQNDVYMLTLNGLYIIHNWQPQKLLDNAFWARLPKLYCC